MSKTKILLGIGIAAVAYSLIRVQEVLSEYGEQGWEGELLPAGFVVRPNVQMTAHFNSSEFMSKKGSNANFKISWDLVGRLEDFRTLHLGGRGVTITSGYRSAAYNATIKGSARNSYHVLGMAADIVVSGLSASSVYTRADASGLFGGIGRYSNFTHVDVGPRGRRW